MTPRTSDSKNALEEHSAAPPASRSIDQVVGTSPPRPHASAPSPIQGDRGSLRVERTCLGLALGLNLILGVALLLAGRLWDSLALSAEGWHGIGDACVSAIGLVAAWLARTPADARHPYGRGKFEVLGAFAMGATLVLVAAELWMDFIRHATGDGVHAPVLDQAAVVFLCLVALLKGTWAVYLARRAASPSSVLLAAESKHARADALVTVLVVGATYSGALGYGWIDAAAGVAVGALIAAMGHELVRDNLGSLTDAAIVEAERVAELLATPGVDVLRVRSRGTPAAAFVELRLALSDALRLDELHEIQSRLRDKLQYEMPHVVDVVIEVVPVAQPRP